jgi:di/tricarboxylate transporter
VGVEYMSPIIILLLGMFLVVLAVEKSDLQRKIAFGMPKPITGSMGISKTS